MTVLRPGEHADELISASLTGDLTEVEQAALSQHLAGCTRCQETLAAFREERRLISGMHHLQPPADLGARVRAGIEAGDLPWWQRRSTLVAVVGSLGAVAAGLLAVVLLNNVRPGPVAEATTTPSASVSFEPSLSVEPTPSREASPSAEPSTTPMPPQPTIAPVGALRYTIERQRPKLEVVGTEQQTTTELDLASFGMPIDAALSPDGEWLAFQVMGDGSGMVDTYAYRIADGELFHLGFGENSPFSRLTWSADGSLLAFTAATGDTPYPLPVDVWVFYADAAEPMARPLTSTGAAFAADFYGTSGKDNLLWVSVAGSDPVTYGVAVGQEPVSAPVDPADVAVETHPGAFLPVRNRADGTAAVVWHGQMSADGGGGWVFARGGMLYLAEADEEGQFTDLGGVEQQVFDTLAIPPSGEAFESARFTWAPDGDSLAVWDAFWVGTEQVPGFPDETRVYFGHPGSGTLIGPPQTLDEADTIGGDVVQVSLAGGPYLALTVVTKEGSEGGSYGPTAELRLVTRNLGNVPDDVTPLANDKVWNGPAFYPAVVQEGE